MHFVNMNKINEILPTISVVFGFVWPIYMKQKLSVNDYKDDNLIFNITFSNKINLYPISLNHKYITIT